MYPLVPRCCQGDSTAQRLLYWEHKSTLFAICLRYSRDRAEAQFFFARRFPYHFPGPWAIQRGNGSLADWMWRVTVRCILKILRKKSPLRFVKDYG